MNGVYLLRSLADINGVYLFRSLADMNGVYLLRSLAAINGVYWLRSLADINGVVLDMERIDKDLLYHQTHVVYVLGFPMLVDSIHGKGILLNGLNQYLDAGKDIACKANLDNCPKGPYILSKFIWNLSVAFSTQFLLFGSAN